VEETSVFLVGLMGLILVPLFIALMEMFTDLKYVAIPLIIIMIVTTAITMGITGLTAQAIISRQEQAKKGKKKKK
jgi:putative effector of murein hydrolase LrgA (UPF0299 family)